ncbi:hypothetical protein FOQG_17832 [Fusarium oxysporum f. sp. raphani 54005]|uniref:TNFR-Cys domain-containing protein n=1 Tax=Fusarium oxysporum f. sp. raphani 54005 TaxID=1089458 RepID=X0B6R4_FUSOX|nr:hypothetical protein FOQG_17832 [Fusarium oxysporum f. sp. raphani 54005]
MFRCLPLLIFAFVGSAFAQGNSQCAQWCAANFRNPGEICTSLAAKGKGPCYDCGPLSTNPAEKLCGEVCKDTSSDNANCGGCGISCPAGTHCAVGACVCNNSNQPQCNGACPDYSSDSANCGKCGHACNPSTEKCQAGTCVPNCPPGQTQCGSSCVDLKTDPKNCGVCGTTCPSGKCENGACVTPSCAGETCDTFTTCGAGGTCVCASTSGGTGFCVDGSTPCSGLADCNTNADCATGEVCAVNTCCVRNVCVGATFCAGNGLKAPFMKVTGSTIGHPAIGE